MTRILVIGASRGIGLATVKALLARGHEVRALARKATSIPIDDARLEKVDGNALDPASVAAALDGVDAVVQSLGVDFGVNAVVKGTTLFSSSTRVLVDAMKQEGLERLVAVTGLGAGDSRGHGGLLYDAVMFPLILKRVYDDKDISEQMIKASGLEWTIARPGILTNSEAGGAYQVLTDPDTWRAAPISRADVGDFLAEEVTAKRYVHQTPVLIN